MSSKITAAIAISIGLGLASCATSSEAPEDPTVTQVQKTYEAVEAEVIGSGDAMYDTIRAKRDALVNMATQECAQPSALAKLDCQYDAASAAFMLAQVTTYDATEVAADLDPYAAASAKAASAAQTCQSVSDARRCAITDEIGRVTPVLAELRGLRMASAKQELRSVDDWNALKNSMFRVSETVTSNWVTPQDLPETAFISAGRKSAGCGIVKASSKIGYAHDQNTFSSDGTRQRTDEQSAAYGAYYQQRQAAMLAIASSIVPVEQGTAPTDDQMRQSLLLECADNAAFQ